MSSILNKYKKTSATATPKVHPVSKLALTPEATEEALIKKNPIGQIHKKIDKKTSIKALEPA